MKTRGTAANYHVLSIIESCARQGVNRKDLLKLVGLTEQNIAQPYERQTQETVLKLWQSAEQLSGNKMLPFCVGSMSTRMQRSAVTSVLESAATLGAALEIGIRYQHITQSIVKSYLYYDKDYGHMIIDNNELDRDIARPQIERQLAFVFSLAKNLCNADPHVFAGVEAHFKGAPKVDVAAYEEVLGIPVKFHCDSDQLLFPIAVMNRKNFSACGEVQASMLLVVQQHERELLNGLGMRSQVRQLIADSLGHSSVDIENISTSLNISTRTMQRRLSDEKTNFSEVYDDVRKQRALEMIYHKSLSMSELSYHLGFNHITNFYTAFNKWTGQPPVQYRTELLAASSKTS